MAEANNDSLFQTAEILDPVPVENALINGNSSLYGGQSGQSEPGLFVYPNPTTGTVNIDLHGYTNPVGTVRVFDAYGKLVLQKQLDGSSLLRMKMDSNDGVYFFSIEVEGEAPVIKRIVIAH